MQSAQTIGIDLPLKALVWEDAEGHVWLSYNDPARSGGHGSCGSDDDRRSQGNRYRGNIRLVEEITATALVSNANEVRVSKPSSIDQMAARRPVHQSSARSAEGQNQKRR
jgi:hypothetical protein